ncbi:MAG: response regulator transcription factor [Chlamydiales bacterium]|nr:response regulator transcription factor [Chlamydiales bacterium]
MEKKKILLIEDEEDIVGFVKLQADLSGYKLLVENDGLAGLRTVEKEKPDAVILDLMLPGMHGLDVCRKIKGNQETKHIPVLMLTAKSEELDVILGLELGADDYITKPFSPKVLFSRIKAVLRRNSAPKSTPKIISFGDFTLDVDRYLLFKSDEKIQVTLSEFGIIRKLSSHPGQVLSRNQLLDEVSNEDAFIMDRNIDVHVASLRKKLGPNFDWIETVRGVGYRFKDMS